ncbi:MAG: hypothetical protein ACRC33_02800 [Gemmataceae bacterium]
MPHLLGIDHARLTFKHQGRHYQLKDVHGNVARASGNWIGHDSPSVLASNPLARALSDPGSLRSGRATFMPGYYHKPVPA